MLLEMMGPFFHKLRLTKEASKHYCASCFVFVLVNPVDSWQFLVWITNKPLSVVQRNPNIQGEMFR